MEMTVILGINRSLLLLAASLSPLALQGKEIRIQRSDLPAAVLSTFNRESEGGSLRAFSKEIEHGHVLYEANILLRTRSKDVLVDEHGAIVEIEQQVSLDSVPNPVRAAVANAAQPGRVLKIESLSREGAIEAYEATIVKHHRIFEVKIAPDGHTIPE